MSEQEKLTQTNINWYPGHMAKAKRRIIEALPRSEETTTIKPKTITKCPAIITTDVRELISRYSFSHVICFAEIII